MMSRRPAYTLINHLSQVKLTKSEAKEFINDYDQVIESLILGLNSLGELMALAIQDECIGISTENMTSASYLISTLCDFIQACDEQKTDCVNYVSGELSSHESKLVVD